MVKDTETYQLGHLKFTFPAFKNKVLLNQADEVVLPEFKATAKSNAADGAGATAKAKPAAKAKAPPAKATPTAKAPPAKATPTVKATAKAAGAGPCAKAAPTTAPQAMKRQRT